MLTPASAQTATPASFDLAMVEAAIRETQFAGRVHHYASTSSTSDLALAAARAGAPGGVWVADEQTAGRGRGGHTWHSSPGDGLYVSVLLRTRVAISNAPAFSFATAIAAQAAIAEVTGMRPREEIDIRLPNDLVIPCRSAGAPAASRKMGGILIETAVDAAASGLRYAILGIGINCNHARFPAELEMLATSLRRELSSASPAPDLLAPALSREALLGALLCALEREVLSWGDDALPGRDPGEFSSWVRGKDVHVAEDGGYDGVTAGLTPDGFLKVRTTEGVTRVVRAGGVRERL